MQKILPSTNMKPYSRNTVQQETEHKNRSRRVTSLVQTQQKKKVDKEKNNQNKATNCAKMKTTTENRAQKDKQFVRVLFFVCFIRSFFFLVKIWHKPRSRRDFWRKSTFRDAAAAAAVVIAAAVYIWPAYQMLNNFKKILHFLPFLYLLSFLVRNTCNSKSGVQIRFDRSPPTFVDNVLFLIFFLTRFITDLFRESKIQNQASTLHHKHFYQNNHSQFYFSQTL